MTAAVSLRLPRRLAGTTVDGEPLPPLRPRLALTRTALAMVFVLSCGLVLLFTIVSSLQQRSSQERLFDRFRAQLAQGTAPVGPTDIDGRQLAIGAPVAYLEIPAVGLRQVVVEGTTGGALEAGPGHRRDSPLPGQAGVSILMGRRAAYGGPFARVNDLRAGDLVHVTTGQGEYDYRVMGVRREGDPLPEPLQAGDGRLVLTTADGPPYFPAGILRVDAELDGDAVAGPRRPFTSSSLPAEEQAMEGDLRTLWALALWLQALLVLALAAVWAWHWWGRAQAWVVFLPPLLLVSVVASGEAAKIVPNLL